MPIRVDNVIGLADLGPHRYDGGLVFVNGTIEQGLVSLKSDGMAYTCRGGFVDTAHVRDYADWTFFFWTQLERTLEYGGRIELPEEGGLRIVYSAAADRDLATGPRRSELAIALAEWLAFELSIWHEIATWYGWSAIAGFPELASAFSPEDLYSNRVGIQLAGEILRSGRVTSIDGFNRSVDEALPVMLERLGVVPHEVTHLAAESVDRARGCEAAWWDSDRRLPEKDLVLRRNLDLGPDIAPWQVPREKQSDELRTALDRHCGDSRPAPLVLQHPSMLAGSAISSLVRLDVRPDDDIAAGLRWPPTRTRWLSQDDLREVVEEMRAALRAELGPNADRP